MKNNNFHLKETKWVLNVIEQYSQSWRLFYKYDQQELIGGNFTNEMCYKLTTSEAQEALYKLKEYLIEKEQATDLFALAKDHTSLEWIFWAVYQSFWWKDVYPSVQEKAAHLLYFIVKNHPFADGNKRSGAFLFILFCKQNNILYEESGEPKINDTWLVALTLLIAQSNPKQKDLMIQLVMNLLG